MTLMQEKIPETIKKFGERLDEALRYAGLQKGQLAQAIGVTRSTVSRWYSMSLPQPRTMEDIARVLGVNKSWLSAGVGPMVSRKEPAVVKEAGESARAPTMNEVFRRLVRAMPPEAVKDTILDYMLEASRQGRTLTPEENENISWALRIAEERRS